jgi:hypothetical protein
MLPLFLLVLSSTVVLQAEELALHRCKVSLTKEPGKQDEPVRTYEVGEKIGVLETGSCSIKAIHAAAVKYDTSSDPFFGPGYEYIAVAPDNSRFAIFFEYEPGHEAFAGFRFAIGKLSPDTKKKGLWKGNVHEGSCFHESITAQLKKLTDSGLKTEK